MPKVSAKLSEYVVVETIGTGSYGTCRKVSRKSDGKIFVWKEVGYGGMSEKEKQLLVQEVNLLRELRHPHIVRYHDRIIEKDKSTLYIIMEYCQGGDLGAVIGKCKEDRTHIDEDMVWKVLSQLLLALQECHKKRDGVHKVLHRDLKPANVFLDGSGNVKLGDFGLARILHHNFSLAQTFVGTPYYMSPEVFSEKAYDEKSDLWSLGCLIHELCTLSPPFVAKDQHSLAAKVMQGRVGRLPRHYSTQLQSIVDSLLVTQPSRRPDIATLLQTVENHLKTECDTLPRHEQVLSESELKAREWQLSLREREVKRREREVRGREKELDGREKELERREEGVGKREKEAERKQKEFKRREEELQVREREGEVGWCVEKWKNEKVARNGFTFSEIPAEENQQVTALTRRTTGLMLNDKHAMRVLELRKKFGLHHE